ncbi:M4 family metallopeptidase [Aureisphaera galaxeae]|uniref:M4 family metallopeptidase n=1 Tax=Aureisphaera galaxeae TaxID=1538023 RepID=UPI0023507712|nr:M4 family metallopeptidase [Aureisphaera galaxeae]MDC8003272.1 M4 family metallopeptidase [Aureisphaera galaxeae]
MRRNTLMLFALSLSVCATALSQNQRILTKSPQQFGTTQVSQDLGLKKSDYISIDSEKSQGKSTSEVILSELKLSNDYSFVRSSKPAFQDRLGYTIVEMHQYYKGVKVEIAHMKAHYKNGQLAKIHGSYLNLGEVATTPSIAPAAALSKAVTTLGVVTPMWEYPEAAAIADYEKPQGELVILTNFEDSSINKLAWKFDVFAAGQPLRDIVYMDARTNEVLHRNPIIKHANNFGHDGKKAKQIAYVPREDVAKRIEEAYVYTPIVLAAGDADTKYSGNDQQVETLQISGTYSLLSQPNGVTVRTYDANNAPANDASSVTDIQDPNNDNDWEASEFPGKTQGELDAHWGAEEVYDYWDAVHGINSFDNAGAAIFSLVHVQTNYNNAFWNGSWMSYGDGSCGDSEGCNGFDILTSMDVCAHEIGHAVMTNTANLAYERESGALNEAFADIWGAAIEFRAKGNGNNANPNDEVWLIGDEIDRRSGSVALRSMEDPNERFQPDTYQGTYWQPATVAEGCITPDQASNDYCGVHTNSGVLNYWFYLIVEGGSGTNDNGDAYSVTGIGMADAELIADRMQRVTITNTTATHADARTAAIQAAQDLYGLCSTQIESVTDAMHAVGVGAAYVADPSCSAQPTIGFVSTSSSTTEGTDCSYTDVNITLSITSAPSATATVNFAENGSGTASSTADYNLQTPSVTFPAGATGNQSMTLRVYHDSFVEGDETVIIDFTVNAGGGDAVANTAADTYTLTISDDDAAPVASVNTTVFSADFESTAGWTIADNDGDTNQWGIFDPLAHGSLTGRWAGSVTNQAVIGGSGTLTPDNFLFSPSFTIPADATNTEITFEIGDFGSAPEHYAVYFASTNSVAAALSGTLVEEANTIGNNTDTRTVNLASLAGQTGHLAFRHYNTTGNSLLMLDTIEVVVTQGTSVQTTVNSGAPDQIDMDGTGTAYTADPSTGDVMLNITNSNSFDYGCVDVSVSRAGNAAQAYNGSTSPNFVTDKTFNISPANTTGSGSASVAFYLTEAEVSGWEAATGLSRTSLVAARGTASSVTETASLTIGSFGTNVTLTGSFTGLNGTYYFGPIGAFVSCSGGTKTWDGANWSPAGAPDATNEVVLNGDYDTSTHGDLNACKLTINTGRVLDIQAGTFASVAGDIVVDGTLNIEHQGSVVQTDANPLVQNNGNINVRLTTPNLASRDFMVMGSPMTAETRESVWNTAFLVLDHETLNFVPNPDVAAALPGAENFADDNYDNWIAMPTGTITPGVGYIVRPQAGYGQPGGIFNYTYDGGTLNTGDINFTVVQNTPGPTAADNKNASPNVLANPYASAISADDFITGNAMIDEVYFWEHLTPPSPSIPGAGSMNFSMEDISMYNLSGGTAAASDPGTTTEPNGMISTGQGFAIKAGAAGTATFTNAMRRTTGNNTLRLQEDKERIWLKISDQAHGLQKQALIAFDPVATEYLDAGYDSRRLATVVSLYTHLQDGTGEFGIQTREAFNSSITVPVGFSTLVDANTEYKISIGAVEGSQLSASGIYLVDNITGNVHDLREDSYGFVSEAGTFNNRFTLQFTSGVLDTNDAQLESIALLPNPTTGELYIVSPVAALQKIEVHDLMGRKITEMNVQGNSSLRMDLSGLHTSVYFVTVTTDQGILTKKVIKK